MALIFHLKKNRKKGLLFYILAHHLNSNHLSYLVIGRCEDPPPCYFYILYFFSPETWTQRCREEQWVSLYSWESVETGVSCDRKSRLLSNSICISIIIQVNFFCLLIAVPSKVVFSKNLYYCNVVPTTSQMWFYWSVNYLMCIISPTRSCPRSSTAYSKNL